MSEPNPQVHTIARAFVTGGSGYVGRNLIRELLKRGVEVRALARSDRSAGIVEALGATAVRGELLDRRALRAGMCGCDTAFHSAAFVSDWCRDDEADLLNVVGTERVLAAARQEGVDTVVHVSTEAVLVGGPTMIHADESWPLPERPIGVYPRTKGEAERVVKRAAAHGQRAVIVRPRFIWGNDDSTLLPRMLQAVDQRVFRWMDGGHYPSSTCHVDNCVEGMILAAERGRSGEAYFLTDGEPIDFRDFIGEMMRTHGVEPPDGEIPSWAIAAAGVVLEALWILPLPGQPPITRSAARIIGPCTVSDAKARAELGYTAHTRREDGLAGLAEHAT